MIGITKKRLYKIKKTKNQSRKIPKRKRKGKRKKKQNKSFRRRRRNYNLKNKSLKNYKGGGFFTFKEIMEDTPNTEIRTEHRAKLARLKELSKRGTKVIIKQIIPVKDEQDLYDINDMFFEYNETTKKIELKNSKDTTKIGDKEERMLKNKLLSLQLRITRKNMAIYTKPLYEILNSILLKQALAEYKGALQRFLKNPLYNKSSSNSLPDIKKNYPFHDIEDENNGSQELMNLLMENKWYKTAFTNPAENYSVESIVIATGFPPLNLETGTQVLNNKEEGVNPPPAMVVPPGVAVSSKRPTPPPPPQLQGTTADIPQKNDSDTETDEDSVDSEETESEDPTIIEDLASAREIAELAKILQKEEVAYNKFDKAMSFDDWTNSDALEAWLKEEIQPEDQSSMTDDQIKTEVGNIKAEAMDNIFQTIQSPGDEEYVTSDKDEPMQESLGFNMMSDKEEQKLSEEIGKELNASLKIFDKVLQQLPTDNTEPLENPVGIEEIEGLNARSDARRSRTDSMEMKSEDGEDINWRIKEEGCMAGCKKCVAGVCKDAKKKVGSLGKKMKGKLQDYADAANDPDTGMRARLGKIAPKKYVNLPPPDKPNVYFKATFQNDDWNLKLEKEGFAKDARSWLARVGIMSGGNLTEIKSY